MEIQNQDRINYYLSETGSALQSILLEMVEKEEEHAEPFILLFLLRMVCSMLYYRFGPEGVKTFFEDFVGRQLPGEIQRCREVGKEIAATELFPWNLPRLNM